MRHRSVGKSIGLWVLIAVFFLPIAFIFYYMIATSLKRGIDIFSPTYKLVFTPTLDNFKSVFSEGDFGSFTLNSFIVGVGSVGFSLLIGLPAAYAIARYDVSWIGNVILASRITPGITFLIPWFLIFSQVGWIDTYQALILMHVIVALPFITWMMVSFFEDMPQELIDSARIDGASLLRTFVSVALPYVRGGIAASAILAFIFSWNNFMFSVVIAGNRTRTLPVAVFQFMSYGSINWGAIAAAAVIMCVPVVLLSLFIQRHIVQGLAGGAVKG